MVRLDHKDGPRHHRDGFEHAGPAPDTVAQMTESEALTGLRTSVRTFLDAVPGGFEVDMDGDFAISRGSARIYVRPIEREGHTFVLIWSPTNVGVPIDGKLTHFLATENAALPFGKLGLNEEASTVHVHHTLLGDFLNREELEVAVNAVAETADQYDDLIKRRFGGQLPTDLAATLSQVLEAAEAATEPPSGAQAPQAQPPTPATVQPLVGFLSFVAAVATAVYAYSVEGSIWLSLFVALWAVQLTGRAAPAVAAKPDKLRRALYFLLLPALATAILAAAYALWGHWWLAALLGVGGGLALHTALAPRLFPGIHREETPDLGG